MSFGRSHPAVSYVMHLQSKLMYNILQIDSSNIPNRESMLETIICWAIRLRPQNLPAHYLELPVPQNLLKPPWNLPLESSHLEISENLLLTLSRTLFRPLSRTSPARASNLVLFPGPGNFLEPYRRSPKWARGIPYLQHFPGPQPGSSFSPLRNIPKPAQNTRAAAARKKKFGGAINLTNAIFTHIIIYEYI